MGSFESKAGSTETKDARRRNEVQNIVVDTSLELTERGILWRHFWRHR